MKIILYFRARNGRTVARVERSDDGTLTLRGNGFARVGYPDTGDTLESFLETVRAIYPGARSAQGAS